MSKNRILSFVIWIGLWLLVVVTGFVSLYFSWKVYFADAIFLMCMGVLLTLGGFIIAPLVLSTPGRIYECIIHDIDIKFFDKTKEAESADFATVFKNTTKQMFKGTTTTAVAACMFMPVPAGLCMMIAAISAGVDLNNAEIGFGFIIMLVYTVMMIIKTLPVFMMDSGSGQTVDEHSDAVIIVREHKEVPVPEDLRQAMMKRSIFNRTNMALEQQSWTSEYINYLKTQYPEIADDTELLRSETKMESSTFNEFVKSAGSKVDYRNSSLYNEVYPAVAKRVNDSGCLTARQNNVL